MVMLGPDGSWILLHGLGDGPSTATGLADHLRAGGASVLAPDLAHLVDADGTATIEHVATAVAAAARASRRPGAIWWLAGHSLGGLVAIDLAERLEGVRGVALLEGSIRPADAEAVRPYAVAPPAGDGYGLLLSELIAAPARSAIASRYLAQLTLTPPSFFRALAAELVGRQAEFAERFRRLVMPRLYVTSTESRAARASPASTLVATGAEIVVMEGTDHWLHAERPEETARVLLRWIDRVTSPSAPD